MPYEPAERAAQAQVLVERLAALVDEAVADPTDSTRHLATLKEVAVGLRRLNAVEQELVEMSHRLADTYLLIEAERERYGRLFELAPDAYVVTDASGTILEANGVAEPMLGTARRFLIGSALITYFDAAHRRRLRNEMSRLHEAPDEIGSFEATVNRRNDRPLEVEMRVSANLSPLNGEMIFRWLIRDISERREFERELNHLHADLELMHSVGEVSRLGTAEDGDTEVVLKTLVMLAAPTEHTHASVLLVDESGKVRGAATSDDVAEELCSVQVEHGGPAIEALRATAPELLTLAELAPWPELAAVAETQGIEWLLAHPMHLDEPAAGAFCVFGRGSPARAERQTALLTEHASAAISNRDLLESTRDQAGHLQRALDSRGVIDQAKGILMAREMCDADHAFDLLRRASQRENRKLHAIAEELVARTAASHGADA